MRNKYLLLILALITSLPTQALTISEVTNLKTGKSDVMTYENGIHVIPVWATWCEPCLKEIPILTQWYYQKKSNASEPIYLTSIAIDQADNVKQAIKKFQISYPVWLFNGKDLNRWFKNLHNPIGSIPFTLISAPKCQFNRPLYGEITTKILDNAISQARQACLKK